MSPGTDRTTTPDPTTGGPTPADPTASTEVPA